MHHEALPCVGRNRERRRGCPNAPLAATRDACQAGNGQRISGVPTMQVLHACKDSDAERQITGVMQGSSRDVQRVIVWAKAGLANVRKVGPAPVRQNNGRPQRCWNPA